MRVFNQLIHLLDDQLYLYCQTCRCVKLSQMVLANTVLLWCNYIGQLLKHFVPFCPAHLHVATLRCKCLIDDSGNSVLYWLGR